MMALLRNESFSPRGCGLRRQRSDLSNVSTASGSSHSKDQPTCLHQGSADKLDELTLKQTLQKELNNKSAISLLQEFLQCSKDFRLPAGRPILQWHYETRMKDHSTLEFQARALFFIGGALHHSLGNWQLSKKMAQRDAAERAVSFFVGHWCEVLLSEDGLANAAKAPDNRHVLLNAAEISSGVHIHELRVLEQYSGRFRCNENGNHWHDTCENGQWQAFVEMDISGVPHKFAGPKCHEQAEAYRQAAKRILWYLQHPDYANAFEPNADALPEALSAEPPCWTRDQSADESQQVVQRKTTIMRVQNRLQQRLGYDLKPGESVWDWTYETDGKSWPPYVRASVRLAVLDTEFTGDWIRTHRGAQLDTCAQVEQFLNDLDKKN